MIRPDMTLRTPVRMGIARKATQIFRKWIFSFFFSCFQDNVRQSFSSCLKKGLVRFASWMSGPKSTLILLMKLLLSYYPYFNEGFELFLYIKFMI